MILLGVLEWKYRGLIIELTRSGERELLHHNCWMDDVLKILEGGYDCSAVTT